MRLSHVALYDLVFFQCYYYWLSLLFSFELLIECELLEMISTLKPTKMEQMNVRAHILHKNHCEKSLVKASVFEFFAY